MTTSPEPPVGISLRLFARAMDEGSPAFAEELRAFAERNQWYFSFSPDDTSKPSSVKRGMKRIESAGSELLYALSESDAVLRANILAEQLVANGSCTDDGRAPELLQRVRRDVTELLALSARIYDRQPRVQTTYAGRPVALGVLRGIFEQHSIPWTSTCPVDVDDESGSASLAVEAVAETFRLSWRAAS